jgi:hypothetical protein
MIFAPHRKHTYGPPRPVTGIVVLFRFRWRSFLTGNTPMDLTACYRDSLLYYMEMFVPHRKHIYGPPRPVAGIALLFLVYDVRTPQKTHVWASTACYGDSCAFLYGDDVRTSQETHVWASTTCYTALHLYHVVYNPSCGWHSRVHIPNITFLYTNITVSNFRYRRVPIFPGLMVPQEQSLFVSLVLPGAPSRTIRAEGRSSYVPSVLVYTLCIL